MRDVDVDVFPVCFCPKSILVAQSSENRTEYVCVCWPHNYLFRRVLPCNQTGIRKETPYPYIQGNTLHCSSKVCRHKYSSENESVIRLHQILILYCRLRAVPFSVCRIETWQSSRERTSREGGSEWGLMLGVICP